MQTPENPQTMTTPHTHTHTQADDSPGTQIYELSEQEKLYHQLGLSDYIRIAYSTDGFTRGALIEVKLNLGASYGLRQAKKQAIKYSNKLMENGEYLPNYFIAVDIERHIALIYEQKLGIGTHELDKLCEVNYQSQAYDLISFIKSDINIKYDVNETTVIGLASKYYTEHPSANKRSCWKYLTAENDKFHKFTGTEKDFRAVMDKLNDPQSQKRLGAWYTPDKYVEVATRYVRNAISSVKTEDYVIIDRCAGTGNLEKLLTDEELSHCILNTYECKEWLALSQIYQDKVRRIIPPLYKPIKLNDLFSTEGTLMCGGDALSEEFLSNFKQEFALRDCGVLTIIMLENIPFKDNSSIGKVDNDHGGTTNRTTIDLGLNGADKNQLDFQFIANAYKFFKPSDYILFAPIKYWKRSHIIDKEFVEGYLTNRKDYGASPSGLPIIHWKNVDSHNTTLELDNDFGTKTIINKVFNTLGHLSEKGEGDFAVLPQIQILFSQMNENAFIYGKNEFTSGKRGERKPSYLNKENFIRLIPLGVACAFTSEAGLDYTESRDVLMKSADGGKQYQQDIDFLNDCLIYTLLTQKNKCSSGCEFYALGFNAFDRKKKHSKILQLWDDIYHRTSIYGLDNNIKEADTFYKDSKGNRIYDNPELHANILDLKDELKAFYIENIRPKMLEYQLVK